MPSTRGFTLIELLIVVAIISILAVIGTVVLKGVTSGARDSQRKEDVDAIAKAYEMKVNAGRYVRIEDSDFASGKKPQDPSKGNYFNYLASDGSGYKICASLDSNPSLYCNTPAASCFCKSSTQDTISSNSTADDSSTNFGSGPGGSSQSSCDTTGTLLTGLVGYWRMDEGNGTTTADSSGNNNNGTWYGSGSHWAPGVPKPGFLNAGQFNGSNDYIGAGTDTEFNNLTAASWEMWVNSGAYNPAADKDFFNGGYWSSPYGPMFFVPSNGNNFTFVLKFTDNSDSDITYYGFTPGQWYHIVAIYDGNKMSVYINGSFFGDKTPGAKIISHRAVNLGGGTPSRYWNGLLDDVRIYNRALSAPEVSNLYNGGNGCVY